MPILIPLLLWLLSLAPATPAAAQSVLRGQVVDATTLAPLQGAEVVVEGRDARTLTDVAGRFVLSGLEAGVVAVRVSLLGYAPSLQADVVLRSSRPTVLDLRLNPQAVELEGLVVDAPAFRVPDAAPTSVQLLSNEELRRTPGGLQDVSRTLLSLPGVLGGVDNRNDLLVRGGGPSENAYYLDGIRIPQINHFATQGASGGALALVNVDFIREVEFFTGSFPVRYGDALSSVLSIRNRPGTPDGVRGDATLGATEAGLTLDGPAGENANWLFSVRRSYLQFLFEALDLPIRPDYWDSQLRFEWTPTDRDRILVVGLGALDNFDLVPPGPEGSFENQEIARRVIDNDQWSYTVGASWRRRVGGGIITTSVGRSLSDYAFSDAGDDGEGVLRNQSREEELRLASVAELPLGSSLRLEVGGEATRSQLGATVFQRAVPGGSLPDDLAFAEELSLWKLGGWAQMVTEPSATTTLTLGLRLDEVTALDDGLALSPRVSGRWEVGADVSLQAAVGVFHQAPRLLSLAVREEGRRVNLGLEQERARQVSGGVAWLVNRGLRISAEAFWKEYDQVPLLRDDPRVALSNLGGDYGFIGAEPLVDDGTGRARGVEVFAQQKLLDQVYFLGAYTLSWSEFAGLDGELRPSSWDRRHALDLTAGWRPDQRWELGTKLRVLSGVAATPFDQEASAEAYAITGRGVPDWDRIGALRTPAYARLDLRAERRFDFDGWNAVVYLDLQNLLGRENAAGYAYTEDPEIPGGLRPLDGAGLLPTFGFSVEF